MSGENGNQSVRRICLVLALVTFALYRPAFHHEFTNYDDSQYITKNPHVTAGVTWSGVAWAFQSGYAANWHPLTWISHMVDCELYGVRPAGHYLTNVVLHVANTVLLFLVFRRLTGAMWVSAFVAALFAWHPMHVESVAWAAERKDVLSAFFFLLTIWSYASYVRVSHDAKPFPRLSASPLRWYLLTLTLFALGLMSKPMLVTLPCVLLLLDFWPLKRITGFGFRDADGELTGSNLKPTKSSLISLALEKLPFLLLSIGSSVATFIAQKAAGAVAPLESLPLRFRLANAAVAYVSYVQKALWPTKLAVLYPLELQLPFLRVAGACLILVLITVGVIALARRRPYLPVGWFWFLGTLVPVIGIVQVGSQAMADRYSYIPFIGLFLMIAWGVADLLSNVRRPALILGAAATSVLAACLLLTSSQLRVWENGETLFAHAIEVTRNNYIAYDNLALRLADQGRLDEAIAKYRTALEIKPDYTGALNNLGMAFNKQNRQTDAIACYEAALKLKPRLAGTHNNWGVALSDLGKLDEAVAHYQEALKLEPDYAEAHYNLAHALASNGKPKSAIEHYLEALRLDPRHAEAHYNLGNLFGDEGKWADAIDHYLQATRLKPDYAEAYNNLGFALARVGKLSDAIAVYSVSLQFKSNLWNARYNLGNALAEQGKWGEAITNYQTAVLLKPDVAEVHYKLGLALLQKSKLAEAASEFSAALKLTPDNPSFHYFLGAALYRQGHTRDAIGHFREAIRLKPDYAEALNRLAWILATHPDPEFRNGEEAVKHAEQACAKTGHQQATLLETLAAAYAEAGRFNEATATAEKAKELAAAAGEKELAATIQKLAEEFLAGRAWRE